MNFTKKVAAGLAAVSMITAGAAVAEYPSKPIKIMVGFSAGGGTDTVSYTHLTLPTTPYV